MSMLKIKSKWFPSWDASAGPPSIRLPSSVQRPYRLTSRMLTCFSETLKEYACSNAKLLQSCLTLHKPMARSLPGSSVHWILQAKILEWVAMPVGCHALFQGIFPGKINPGIETESPALQADSLPSESLEKYMPDLFNVLGSDKI